MKITLQVCCMVILSATTISCSMFGTQPDNTPLPPQSVNSGAAVIPQIGSNKAVKIESSNNYSESQSAYKRRQIVEDRGPGGSVNKITVDNAGDVPDYYLYPSNQTQYNTNDNPDKISVPNWQINW